MDWWQQKGLSTGIRLQGRYPKQMIQKQDWFSSLIPVLPCCWGAGRDGLGVNGEARSMTQKSEYVGNDQVMVGNGDSLPIANWYGFSFGPSGSISSFESVTCSYHA